MLNAWRFGLCNSEVLLISDKSDTAAERDFASVDYVLNY